MGAESSAKPRIRIDGIEAGRGIAALLVVLVHVGHHLEQAVGYTPFAGIFKFGHAGVDFFFVLSGFIILTVHRLDIGDGRRLGPYLNRRFSRVYPFYWIVFTGYLIMVAGTRSISIPDAADVARSYALIPYAGGPFYQLAWTLQHEILFYGCFALMILHRRIGQGLFAVWFIFVAVSFGTSHSSTFLNLLGSPFNIEFLFGMAAAQVVHAYRVPFPRIIGGLGVLLFAASGAAEVKGWIDGFGPLARILYGLPAMLVVIGVVGSERLGLLKVPELLRRLGSASYALYLCHVPLTGIAYKGMTLAGLDTVLSPAIQMTLMTVVAVVGSVLISQWVEFPIMNVVRRWIAATPRPLFPPRKPDMDGSQELAIKGQAAVGGNRHA